MKERVAEIDKKLGDVASRHEARFIPLINILCPDTHCEVERNNQPLYLDRHHLSPMAARWVLSQTELPEILKNDQKTPGQQRS